MIRAGKVVATMGKAIKVGDKLQISTSDIWGLGTVMKIEEIESMGRKGLSAYMRFEDHDYDAQGMVFWDDECPSGRQSGERLRRSGIPPEFAGCDLSSIDWGRYAPEDAAMQKGVIEHFIAEFGGGKNAGRGLYISSKASGSGKTMIACAVAIEIMKLCDIPVKFIGAADYLELVKEKDEAGRERIQSLFDAALLVLDDIGAHAGDRDWINAALFRLIDSRYANHRATIFTSNVAAGGLKMDARVTERIYRMTVPVPMPEINVGRKLADERAKEFIRESIGK